MMIIEKINILILKLIYLVVWKVRKGNYIILFLYIEAKDRICF